MHSPLVKCVKSQWVAANRTVSLYRAAAAAPQVLSGAVTQ